MNQNSFMGLINPVKDKMYRLALRLLVSKDSAQDATQEVFLKLWDRKDKIKDYANVEAFMMTMTKNYCLDQLKSRKNNNLKIVHSNYESHERSVFDQLDTNDQMEKIRDILELLPEQQKIIFQLRDIEEYEYEEISEMTNMNQTAVRVALSRARKKIREELLKKHQYGIN